MEKSPRSFSASGKSLLTWRWLHFADLSTAELYAILRLRQQVFIVEQQCPYVDCDGLDLCAWHLIGTLIDQDHALPVAYLRVLPPGNREPTVVIGRLLTDRAMRGKGLAKHLLTLALAHIHRHYGPTAITISAQNYLRKFYEGFSFHAISEVYEEDGIPHLKMRRLPPLPTDTP
jgi:ElaA protein